MRRFVLLLLLLSLPRVAFAGGALSPECNWFGAQVGVLGEAWQQVLKQRSIDALLWKHCNTPYCGREDRGHYSMVYEHMPCNRTCFKEKKARYVAACGGP
ncbi:hypothetical protein Mmc1_3111 [Magnetococcus marinus MC-1]|uniref:Secreted protein n=1 Tax=Magnetococcus marinus (strain ATCC BAA-1437 / JCM 17883 / MC-1) TaxID=156889 RepID=A0LCA8_MAGMM|nr:hypothetical protein [Magnetococcus marinus]ABK45601.1 hypothetical protein Mmc1_3111 [Magnetococcus marinus MC-1]